jgi:hypothetical protein
MEHIKKHKMLAIGTGIVLIAVISFSFHQNKSNNHLSDYRVPPLIKPDCSSLKNSNNSPVTISLNAPNVSIMRDKIKTLALKYKGVITSDSFSSYPLYQYPTTPTVSESMPATSDSATISAIFEKSQNEFLTELNDVVRTSGGVNTGYSYTDLTQPQYGGVYTTYASCADMMHNISSDLLQLQIFTKAIKEVHEPEEISLLSKSISSARDNLQSDVNNINNLFVTSDKPSVSITINTIQK